MEKIANRIQHHIIYHDQVRLIPGMQSWFNIWKFINILYVFIDPGRHCSYPTDAVKALNKIQNPFLIKITQLKLTGALLIKWTMSY